MDENDKEDIEAQKLIREVRSRMSELGNSGEDNLFRSARSFKNWTDKIVSDRQLHKIYELMRLCPTYANACPIRIKIWPWATAKKKLEPIHIEANRAKSMAGPVVAILGNDREFFEHSSFLWPR